MYNKIASIILNSAKAAGVSDVYVAQPDSLKENLAGKVFVMAEIGGKKAEGRKIFDFLVMALNDNYYNDEKILFRGKIEGLKIENIFEAAITKTNKNLADFMADEKIHLNPAATNITVGIIYENKLHFTNFGRNRALLLYRRGEDYEIINVEANAADAPQISDGEEGGVKSTKLFSSVISGEVPLNSYFVFASEALPEYLSSKEMIGIISKLPPITAAEQIKNVLIRMNTYVPFLGIIIKNTAGQIGQETKEDLEENLSSRQSASSLNYTEEKTEQMLAPAGLISIPKLLKQARQFAGQLKPKVPERKKYLKSDDKPVVQPALDLGQIKSHNMARSDSFFIKEKIIFKKKPGWIGEGLKNGFGLLLNLLTADPWLSLVRNTRGWIKRLDQRNRLLFLALGAFVIIFTGSVIFTRWNGERQKAAADFSNLVNQIEQKEDSIDAHLLYNDESGAGQVLVEAQALIASLPQKTADQQAEFARLSTRLETVGNKLQRIVKVGQAQKAFDLSGTGVKGLAYAGGKVYAFGAQDVYELASGASSTRTAITGAANLAKADYDNADRIYFQDGGRLVQFNLKTKASGFSNVTLDSDLTGFNIYSGNLYVLAAGQNQIYRYAGNGGFGAKSEWLKDPADLSQATDLGVDGDIYLLKSDGSIAKFRKNHKVEYAAGPLTPVMTGANKIIIGTGYIYVFEPGSKRLAVLTKKDGRLVNQYVVDSLAQPSAVAVDEAGHAAYFLDGEAIYKIGLNQ